MGKNLIIVESPAKARTIGKFLGNKYNIKASMGHVRDLPQKTFGVSVQNNFKAQYIIDPKKKKIITELKKAAEIADNIYLAPDHDREGEAIAWHLVNVLQKEINNKPIYRIIFNEITKTAIRNALANPGEIDQRKVESQQARRILDRIVGYNISPLLWKIITTKLSAGRVQSVALRLICERDEEIKNFVPKEFWNIEAILSKNELPSFKAVLQKWENKKIELKTKEQTDNILKEIKNNEFILSKIKETSRKIHPSPPYITSTLQQDAARLLNFTAKKTMMIAQQLYEGITLDGETVGLISYMRTDSLRVANEALNMCRNLISERFGSEKLNPKTRVFKNRSSAQDAHEAIRPTNPFKTPESISPFLKQEQLKLYTLIWQKFVATQMLPALLKSKNLDITAGKATFNTIGSTIIDKGFIEVFPHTKISLGENIDPGYQQGDTLEPKKLEGFQRFTKPPVHYSEALLIKELESKGIGRPSTYASITSTILTRKYVRIKAKRFYPTELGLTVNNFLVSNFEDFFNVEFTAKMENGLDDVEYGKVIWYDLLRDYYDSLKNLISKVNFKKAKESITEKTDIKCEKCGGDMVIKWGRNGQFLACSNFPQCKNIKSFEKDEEGKVKVIESEKIEEKCPQCGSDLIVKNGRFGKFIACSNYPRCKFTKPVSLGIRCPECKTGEIVEKKNKKGRYFYSCTQYPECKFITNIKPLNIKCPECGNYYLEQMYSKSKGKYKKCPKCGKELY
jgi:DNA topoisomerase-1